MSAPLITRQRRREVEAAMRAHTLVDPTPERIDAAIDAAWTAGYRSLVGLVGKAVAVLNLTDGEPDGD